ncbi:MAG TPA: metal ABC transporter permease [Gemmataceae bacterium]|jgi:zinc/manganese transport system permease protein
MGIFLEPFVRNAYLAATLAAVCAGVVGYFVVLRRLSFASHALAHVGFTGATAAVLVGADLVLGTLLFTVATGIVMGLLGDRLRGRDAAIGTTLAFTMGLGLLFLYLSTKLSSMATNILFGDILAVSDRTVGVSCVFATVSLATMAVIYRPLLFASVDPEVAAVRGVPVRLLGVVFMVLLAWTVAQAVQVVGILLIFSLLVTPAAAAQHLTARPALGVAWSVGLAAVSVWAGLTAACFPPYYPPSFFITTISFLLYVGIRCLVPGVGSARRRSARAFTSATAAEVRVMETVEDG